MLLLVRSGQMAIPALRVEIAVGGCIGVAYEESAIITQKHIFLNNLNGKDGDR